MASLPFWLPVLQATPRGDGHPVLVVPGFAASVQLADLVGAVDHDIDGAIVDLRDPVVFGEVGLDPMHLGALAQSDRLRFDIDTVDSFYFSGTNKLIHQHRPNITCRTRDENIH